MPLGGAAFKVSRTDQSTSRNKKRPPRFAMDLGSVKTRRRSIAIEKAIRHSRLRVRRVNGSLWTEPLNGNYCFASPAAAMYFVRNSATRARHMPTNASDVIWSTDFHTFLMAGRVLPQIARLHHLSAFSLPSRVEHMDLQAMRSGRLMCSAAPSQPC